MPVDVPRPLDETLIESIAPLIQERITLMTDALALVDFFWQSEALWNNILAERAGSTKPVELTFGAAGLFDITVRA